MKLSEEELKEYKKHPRVLEVRFILLFNLIEKEYGYLQTMKFFESLCSAFNCNMVFLQGIIDRRFDIQRNSKKNFVMWRQEVIFASTVWGESLYKVANDYLNIKPATLYTQMNVYDINKFCTNEWLEKLDNQITLCAQKSYKIEVLRVFEIMEMFADVMIKWKGGK